MIFPSPDEKAIIREQEPETDGGNGVDVDVPARERDLPPIPSSSSSALPAHPDPSTAASPPPLAEKTRQRPRYFVRVNQLYIAAFLSSCLAFGFGMVTNGCNSFYTTPAAFAVSTMLVGAALRRVFVHAATIDLSNPDRTKKLEEQRRVDWENPIHIQKSTIIATCMTSGLWLVASTISLAGALFQAVPWYKVFPNAYRYPTWNNLYVGYYQWYALFLEWLFGLGTAVVLGRVWVLERRDREAFLSDSELVVDVDTPTAVARSSSGEQERDQREPPPYIP